MQELYCEYYQGVVLRPKVWFVIGCLRSQNNLLFERALDGKASLFEFFVPPMREQEFLAIMSFFQEQGYVLSLEKRPNRIKTEGKI